VKKYYPYFYLGLFIILSIVSLKLSVIRVGQLLIMGLFTLVFIDDYQRKQVDIGILSYFFIGAVLMVLVSLNSIYGKIGEVKFFIKYLFIFPMAFYIGAKSIQKLTLHQLVNILDLSVLFYILVAFLVKFHLFPFDSLIVYREGFGGMKYIEFQGTFAEAGILAEVVFMMTLISFLIRYEFNIPYPNNLIKYLFYGVVTISLALSKNKTIWIALIMVMIILVVFKFFFSMFYTNYFQPKYKSFENETMKLFENINSTKLLTFSIMIVVSLYFINELLPEPVVTMKMIKLKLTQERGKAFIYTVNLLQESNWLGGYGFGYVEYYFTNLPIKILGLGKDVGMIFNGYLDVWVSAGLIGLFFHLGLLYISFSKKYFLTMIVPITLFIYSNFNPFLGDEFNYIFLGISYGIAKRYAQKEFDYL